MTKREALVTVAAGAALGGGGVLLSLAGNPENTGICVSCFLVNIAGSLGLFHEARMSYPRPEITAIVVGAFLAAACAGGFRPRVPRRARRTALAAAVVIVGCEVFIGCPVKLGLRLGGGDLTALAGAAGIAAGVYAGTIFLKEGYEAIRARPATRAGRLAAFLLPAAALFLLVAHYLRLPFLAIGSTGPAARHAPFALSLAAGSAIGILAQRSRFCVTGSLRNFFLGRDRVFLYGLAAFIAAAFAAALLGGSFHPGYYDQPGVHTSALWAFLGMFAAGLGSVYLGGCPFRQLVLAGSGDMAAALSVTVMLAAAGASHGLGLASTADGPTWAGKAALLAGLCLLLLPVLVRDEDAAATGVSSVKGRRG